jgi:hypothetical protein
MYETAEEVETVIATTDSDNPGGNLTVTVSAATLSLTEAITSGIDQKRNEAVKGEVLKTTNEPVHPCRDEEISQTLVDNIMRQRPISSLKVWRNCSLHRTEPDH